MESENSGKTGQKLPEYHCKRHVCRRFKIAKSIKLFPVSNFVGFKRCISECGGFPESNGEIVRGFDSKLEKGKLVLC